jgi:hypothetical protein
VRRTWPSSISPAPRNERGEVVFTADVFILKPVDQRRGNGRVYYEVPNRGGKGILRRLQYGAPSLDPREARDFGDGWLMEQGFALVWMGWQWDVPDTPGLLRLRAPIATERAKPITGLVRSVILLDERKDQAPLGDRGMRPTPRPFRRPTAACTCATIVSTPRLPSPGRAGASWTR